MTNPPVNLECQTYSELPPSMEKLLAMSERLANSKMIPRQYFKQPEDIMVALQTGIDLGLSSYVIALNEISLINGRASISSKLAMALVHKSRIFSTRISFEQKGEKWDELRVWASAKRTSDGKEVKAEASINMALAEGWTKNPKYKSMPIQMLSYRAAILLIRRYAPEVLLGIASEIETEIPEPKTISINNLNQAIAKSST